MSEATVTKDPAAVLDYGLDWANGGANDGTSTDPGWLQGATIESSTWSIEGPDDTMIVDSDSFNDTLAICVISGGTSNRDYIATNRVTTALTQDERSITIRVVER